MQKKCVIRDKCILLFTLLIFSIGTYSLFGNTRGINLFDLAAYQHRIKGVVTDTNGIPIQGGNVKLQDASQGTFTNEDGIFYLEASPSDVLVVSYIGFKTLVVKVGDTEELSLVLEEDITDLGAVTVNAGYYTVSEKERTGSISKITAAAIEEQPVTNVLATMQGQMPGVFITQDSGVPGGGFQIQIRGQNSLRSDGNAPLYIIDGVPYSTQSISSFYTSGSIPGGSNPLNSIDPSSIAGIEVLKDADATAIYGSRGANGVVLITPKKGKAGKTRFSLDYAYGLGWVRTYMNLMNTEEYLDMRQEAYQNDGYDDYPSNAYDVNGTWDPNRYTDWEEVLIGGSSEITDIKGSISGGNAQTQFNVNGSYHRETTVYPGDFSYNKAGVHSNLSHQTTDGKFKLQFSGNYTLQQNNLPGESLTSAIYQLAPNAPALYNEDGSLNWENSTWENPLAPLQKEYASQSYDLTSNLRLSYELLPHLYFQSNFGYTHTQYNDDLASPHTIYDPAYELTSDLSSIYKNQIRRASWIIEPQLDYSVSFGDFNTKLLVGGTFQKLTNNREEIVGIGFVNNSLINNIAAANTKQVLADEQTVYKYNAIYGRLNVALKNRYILNITGRRDGSSRFGSGKQFANFGAVGFAWLFSEEPFIENTFPFLSYGKFRSSYGTTGSDQIGDYQYLDTYTVNGNNYGGTPTMEPSRLFNPLFSWEENKKFEIALETGFLNDRILVSIARYQNRSSNQLVGIPLPQTTGFPSIQANLDATVENSGWEFEFNTTNIKASQLSWRTSLNLSIPTNKLVSFPGLETSTYANTYVIGAPLNIDKVYSFQGLNSATGLYEFTDYNEDDVLSRADDREGYKDLNPSFYGGLQNSFNYKGFRLDFLFQFVKQENYSGISLTGLPGQMVNQPKSVQDHWMQPGDQTTYQPYSTGLNRELYLRYLNYIQSDAIITDASYIRLKTISVSYTLPENMIQGVQCRLFLRGQNLLTFTPYEGMDPESGFRSSLPPLRVLTTGLQLNF